MISLLLEKVIHGELNFGQLEKLLWESTLHLFQHVMAEVLEQVDQKLMEHRDKTRFENKEKNPRSVQTLVGSIDFERRYYWDTEEHRWTYLLDEMLELEAEKTIGPGLLQLAVTWATKGPSYRDARDQLTDLFDAQVLSHEAIRQALLEVGTSCEQARTDYTVVNPTYVCDLEAAEEFWEQVRGIIHAKYRNVDRIPVIINGDGAEWIRQGMASFAKGMYQYDRFHIARELRRALRHDGEALRKANKALRKNDIGSLAIIVTKSMVSCEEEEQKETLKAFNKLLLTDQEYIVDYRNRLRKEGFDVPEDWRGLGAAESNVNKFKNRTAKRGRAWSPAGLEAILMTLTHLFEGTLQASTSRTLADAEEWFLDNLTAGVGHVVTRAQGILPGVKKGSLPASRHGTQGFSKVFNRLHYVDVS